MNFLYETLSGLITQKTPIENPKRILLVRPCCIGDVILATPTLKALRRRYPRATITWAVSSWARPAIKNHDLLDNALDVGASALPVHSVGNFWRFVRLIRQQYFDLAISLVRSPLMSLALQQTRIQHRVGLDSDGRGFGYTLRIPLDPNEVRHEAGIYLKVAKALGANTVDCYANIPVDLTALEIVRTQLLLKGVSDNFAVINPAGGDNPAMTMHHKRWLPQNFAKLADELATQHNMKIVLLAGPNDSAIVQAVQEYLQTKVAAFVGELSFPEMTALASVARIYIGNDTGLTHLASATNTKTAMIMGPSDPKRYAPYHPNSIALWKPVKLAQQGVSAQDTRQWDWERDGIGVEEVYKRVVKLLNE